MGYIVWPVDKYDTDMKAINPKSPMKSSLHNTSGMEWANNS